MLFYVLFRARHTHTAYIHTQTHTQMKRKEKIVLKNRQKKSDRKKMEKTFDEKKLFFSLCKNILIVIFISILPKFIIFNL